MNNELEYYQCIFQLDLFNRSNWKIEIDSIAIQIQGIILGKIGAVSFLKIT